MEANSNLSDVSVLLREHKLNFSANSWKQVGKEIDAGLKAGKLFDNALFNLLRSSEEYGGQHVFTYEAKKAYAYEVVNNQTLSQRLHLLGRSDLLQEPDLHSSPGGRALADARIEKGPNGRVLVLKAVESRVVYKLEDEYDEKGGDYRIKRYRRTGVRAVDVLRVHDDGFSELRIHNAHSGDLQELVTATWHFFAHFVSRFKFDDLSISDAQQRLWKHRETHKAILRYSDSRLRDTSGASLTAATGAQQHSLFDNVKVAKSIDTFWDDDTVCDRSNMWWLRTSDVPNSIPTRPVHVMISGAVNQFVIPGACRKEDYEYVLAQIRKANF